MTTIFNFSPEYPIILVSGLSIFVITLVNVFDTGISTINVVPIPTSLSTNSLPFILSTRSLEIDKPSPVPTISSLKLSDLIRLKGIYKFFIS